MNVLSLTNRRVDLRPQAGIIGPRNLWIHAFSSKALLIVVHVPIALLMFHYPTVATLHAVTTLLIGLGWALSGSSLRRVAYVAAYITGAEVLWRMSQASIPWESGKYATSAILITALFRTKSFGLPLLPVLYFALLLPAITPTVMKDQYSLEIIRRNLSFNLSGPFALMTCVWFFSHLKLNSAQLERLFLSIIAPITGIGVVTLFSTWTAQDINWTSESNLVTSGGFGPNQVAGALGLGALLAFLLLIRSRDGYSIKVPMFGLMLFLAVQSALTFSRGGLYGAFGAAFLASFHILRDRKARLRMIMIVVLLVLAATLIIPKLVVLTEGAIIERFKDTQTSHRADYVTYDLNAWWANPFLGAGVGESFRYNLRRSMSHTELTRLLAEHGSLGLFALTLLLIAGFVRLKKARTAQAKAVISSTIGWSLMFMMDKAMRLVAPAFCFGVAFATLEAEQIDQRTRRTKSKSSYGKKGYGATGFRNKVNGE